MDGGDNPGGRGFATPLLNLISPLVYNPHRTCNLMGEFNRELQELAARREPMTSGRADQRYAEVMRPRFKNYFGTIMAERGTPAYTKVVKSYWELNDAREKLAALATGT